MKIKKKNGRGCAEGTISYFANNSPFSYALIIIIDMCCKQEWVNCTLDCL